MDMDHGIQPQRNNEKDATIKFEVFEHVDSKRLKLVKPVIDEARYFQEYPNVSIIKHSAANSHAMNIMCSMNHKNIVSMKALGPKSQDGYLIFIEECDGSMNSRVWRDFYDAYGHIPSDTFRTIVSEIIEGIEFLRRNRKYHGNLTWKSTLYKHPSSVKLCNFRSYDMVMSRDDAQWQDWMFLRQMLKDVLDVAMKINQDPQREEKLFCDVIDGLIELIGNSDRNSLYRIKDIVLGDVFFWTSGRRTIFIMSTVSGLMLDSSFCEEINSSDICELPWDSHDTNGFLDSDLPSTFSVLLEHCKNYRANLIPQPPELDCNRKADCVKFICASYTHQHQEDIKNICKGRADLIFRRKYPKLFIELNRIVKGSARPAAVRSLTHPSHTSHHKIVSAN